MKKWEHLKENVMSGMELPADLIYGDAIVTITGGGCVLIENYRCIIKYTSAEIVILAPRGRVVICGERLKIPWYTPEEMIVRGCISGVFPQRGNGND